ncbi:MAG: hypothetical protein WCK65_05100, partial [Rhodospirillaceae bacterium]
LELHPFERETSFVAIEQIAVKFICHPFRFFFIGSQKRLTNVRLFWKGYSTMPSSLLDICPLIKRDTSIMLEMW